MIRLLQLFFLVCCLVGTIANIQECQPGWTKLGTSCYSLKFKRGSGEDWESAQEKCKAQDSHLARIGSKEENDMLKNWLAKEVRARTEGVWIDGCKTWRDDEFDYEDYEELTFTDWADEKGLAEKSFVCAAFAPHLNFSWVAEDDDKKKNMEYLCEQALCEIPVQCFEGSCYTLSCGSFSSNNPKCPKGNLVTIDSEAENNFIKKFLESTPSHVEGVWTGGYCRNGFWRWRKTAQRVYFFDWRYQRPSKSEAYCIRLTSDSKYPWTWTSEHCVDRYPILCEFPESQNE